MTRDSRPAPSGRLRLLVAGMLLAAGCSKHQEPVLHAPAPGQAGMLALMTTPALEADDTGQPAGGKGVPLLAAGPPAATSPSDRDFASADSRSAADAAAPQEPPATDNSPPIAEEPATPHEPEMPKGNAIPSLAAAGPAEGPDPVLQLRAGAAPVKLGVRELADKPETTLRVVSAPEARSAVDQATEPTSPQDSLDRPVIASVAPPIAEEFAPDDSSAAGEGVADPPSPQLPPAPGPRPPVPEAAQIARSPASPAGPLRTPAMLLVTRRAEEHIRYAFDLAERGAAFSARAEFIEALKLIAQARDREEGVRSYSRAVTAGLRALQEAEDFEPRDAQWENSANMTRLIAAHRTPIFKDVDTGRLSPIDAMQQYYIYAKEQLTVGGSHEPTASLALYGLARLQPVLGLGDGLRNGLGGPKAIALHQAALMVDPQNYLAANELGVLLARYGQLEDAEALLVHSASLAQRPETWHNLATIYEQLGASDKARSARQRSQSLAAAERGQMAQGNSPPGGSPSMIYWVDLATFSGDSGPDAVVGPVEQTGQDKAKATATVARTGTPKKPTPSFPTLISRGWQDLKAALRLGQRTDRTPTAR